MKKCSKCLIDKNISEFPKNKRFKSGYNSICKICCNFINKKYRDDNLLLVKKSRKRYYEKNVYKMRDEKRKYYKLHKKEKQIYDIDYRKKNAKKIREYKKEW